MNDNRKNPGFCVTCPKCGRVQQRSITTESIIICPRCGYEYYLYLKNGVYFGYPVPEGDKTQFYGQVKQFTMALEHLIPAEAAV